MNNRINRTTSIFTLMLTAAAINSFAQSDIKFRISQNYVPDEILINFRKSITPAEQEQFNAQVNAKITNRQTAIAAFHDFYNTSPAPKIIYGWQRVILPGGKKAEQALGEMKENVLINSIEPNYIICAFAASNTYTPNGAFNDFYYLDGHSQWWINRTKGDAAYREDFAFAASGDIVVAVLDSGIAASHPELITRLVPGYDFINSDNDPDDDHGHGTHVSGLIAAACNNSIGVAGTAWKEQIKVMPVKVLDETGYSTVFSLALGINWAVEHGARIINMSLGGPNESSLIRDACNNAIGQGVLLVAAAGNSFPAAMNLRDDPQYPACYSGVMSIGATNAQDYKSYYSSYSDPAGLVDCAAPGGDDLANDGLILSTMTGNWYAAWQGTSMASPQVAALAALLLLQLPSRTPEDIKRLIMEYCEAGTTATHGAGRINIMASLAEYKTPTATITPTVTATPRLVVPREDIMVFPQPGREYVRLAFNFKGVGKVTLELYNVLGERVLHCQEQPVDLNSYSIIELRTQELASGIYYIKIKIKDISGKRQLTGKLAIAK